MLATFAFYATAAFAFVAVQRSASALPSTKEKLAAVLLVELPTSFKSPPKSIPVQMMILSVANAMAVAKTEKEFELDFKGKSSVLANAVTLVDSTVGTTDFEAKLTVTIGSGGTMTATPTEVTLAGADATKSTFATRIKAAAEYYLSNHLKTAVKLAN